MNPSDALARLEQIRVVQYAYKPEIANEWGLNENSRHRVGVIAQELAAVLPDAVTDTGDFLQVTDLEYWIHFWSKFVSESIVLTTLINQAGLLQKDVGRMRRERKGK